MKLNKRTLIIAGLIIGGIWVLYRWRKYKTAFLADQVAKGQDPSEPYTNPNIIDFFTNPITNEVSTTNTDGITVDPVVNQSDKKAILDTWLNTYNVSLDEVTYNAMLTQSKSLLEQYASYTPTEMITYIDYLQTTNNSTTFLDNVKAVLVAQGF